MSNFLFLQFCGKQRLFVCLSVICTLNGFFVEYSRSSGLPIHPNFEGHTRTQFNANRNHNNYIVNFILTNIPGNRFILFRSNSARLKMDVYDPLLMLIGMAVDPTYSRASSSMPISELCTIFLKKWCIKKCIRQSGCSWFFKIKIFFPVSFPSLILVFVSTLHDSL